MRPAYTSIEAMQGPLDGLWRLQDGMAAIRRGESEKIEGDFPQDIASLAVELNLLVAANREVVERARTQVGNLAHALKTPLSVILNEAAVDVTPLAGKVKEQGTIMRDQVTDADLNAVREMCQWFQAQYNVLVTQVDTLTSKLAAANREKYAGDGVQAAADIVTTNLDQSVDFLTPRAQALTQLTDSAGGVYFPMYQGEHLYRLWQQLSNVSIGIKSHHSSWDFGPPMRLAERYGALVNSSHICR